MDGMFLTYALAAGVTVLGFLLWEPWTSKIRALREVKIVDAIKFVDPGACFLYVNWSESGEKSMGPCYIEEIRRPGIREIFFKGAASWIIFRSFEDGSKWVLTGSDVMKCIRRTFPHPENSHDTLYWVSPVDAEALDLRPWPGKEKVQEYLAEKLGITETIFGTYKKAA